MSNWTLVTAYFDLTKRPDASKEVKNRGVEHYFKRATGTLSLNYPMVIYCELESVELISKLRTAPTRIVLCDFEAFTINGHTFTELRERIKENRIKTPYYFDPRNTPSYYLVCMVRFLMMIDVIQNNPFSSTHFAWINLCIEHVGINNIRAIPAALAVNRDKFSACYINYIAKSITEDLPTYFQYGRCSMASGFFTGNAYYMKNVCELLLGQFQECLDLGYGHADEQLFQLVYVRHPDLFEHYYGDYTEIITNYTGVCEGGEKILQIFIAPAFKDGDYAKCLEACHAVFKGHITGDCPLANKDLASLATILARCDYFNTKEPSQLSMSGLGSNT
jgi:hypothetical protein